jgi:hypothetical protein
MPAGRYYVQVYHHSSGGSTQPYHLRVAYGQTPNNPPNMSSDPSPTDGATGQSVNVTLSWIGGDPDGDSVTYDVYLGPNDSTPDTMVCNNASSAICDPGTLDHDTHYYWQVVARDEHGATTTGPVWDFTTQSTPNSPPHTPSNPSPADGAAAQSANVNLSWAGGDPDGDNVTYDVFTGTEDPPTTLVCDDVPVEACDPGTLSQGMQYWWRVVATDEHETTTAGPVWDFSTSTSYAYRDDFDSPDSGWITRRTSSPDLDTMEARYSDGKLYTKADDRYDFGVFSPLVEAPPPPYRITMRTKLVAGVDAPGYGIVFRSDQGDFCPVDRADAQDEDGCFCHYFRLNVSVDNMGNHIRYEVKRIDSHDDRGRAEGKDLSGGYHTIDDQADWDGWNDWEIEVYEERFKVSVNGEHLGTYWDDDYAEDGYFGVLTSVYEYGPSEFEHEYFCIELLE